MTFVAFLVVLVGAAVAYRAMPRPVRRYCIPRSYLLAASKAARRW